MHVEERNIVISLFVMLHNHVIGIPLGLCSETHLVR